MEGRCRGTTCEVHWGWWWWCNEVMAMMARLGCWGVLQRTEIFLFFSLQTFCLPVSRSLFWRRTITDSRRVDTNNFNAKCVLVLPATQEWIPYELDERALNECTSSLLAQKDGWGQSIIESLSVLAWVVRGINGYPVKTSSFLAFNSNGD